MSFSDLSNTYYAMRHGESVANQKGIIVSDPKNGVPGYGLSGAGRGQVEHALSRCEIVDEELLIVSSDFRRARETAELALAACGAGHAIIYDTRLRERYFGSLELGSNKYYSTVWAEDRLDANHVTKGVESASSVLERTTGLVMDLEAQYQGRVFLLVSHGDAIQILLTAFQRVSPSRHRDMLDVKTAEIRLLNPAGVRLLNQ